MEWAAGVDINLVNGRFYSAGDTARPMNGGTVRVIEAGSPISPADVGGGAVFEQMAAAELVVPAQSGDARVLRALTARRQGQ